MNKPSAHRAWIVWLLATAGAAALISAGLVSGSAAERPVLAQVRSMFSPGQLTSGHYQIELACEACHTSLFGGAEVLQQACVGCHGGELAGADDKHPLDKFTDPRNAELLAQLDAVKCVTCHTEHRRQLAQVMGVTQPKDLCIHCHQQIGTERASHEGMKFDTCSNAGCHNYHDNRALYENFLAKNGSAPPLAKKPRLPATNFLEVAEVLPSYPLQKYPLEALPLAAADSDRLAGNQQHQSDWLASAHARGGVNCSACHQPGQIKGKSSAWVEKPGGEVCATCHSLQNEGFLTGKHGMRIKAGLSPMRPERSTQLPFKEDAAHRELTCTTCHGAHRFDSKAAAVEACLGCHDDRHSQAYQQSPHAKLWRSELAEELPAGSGVSCASCHLPRIEHSYEEQEVRQIYAQHNQNDTLRPNEKMIRPVCMSCHGLSFALDALADAQLIQNNFTGAPQRHVPSIDMAMQRRRKPAPAAQESESEGAEGD